MEKDEICNYKNLGRLPACKVNGKGGLSSLEEISKREEVCNV